MPIVITLLVFLLVVVITSPKEWLRYGSEFRSTVKALNNIVEEKRNNKNYYLHWLKPVFGRLAQMLPIKKSLPKYQIIQKNLYTANIYRDLTIDDFIVIKLAAAVGLGIYFLWMYYLTGTFLMLLSMVVMPFLGYNLPDSLLAIKARKRREQIERELPTVLNGLAVICDAGLNLLPAIEEVCRHNQGVLAEELRDTLEEIYLGTPYGEAFEKLASKCGVTDLSFFISALLQAMEKGGSGVTMILKVQARELWLKRRQKAETLGQKASLKLFLPLVFLVFPALTIFMLAPAVISTIKLFGGVR